MEALAAAGVDMIEVGMPYSDPLADGPVIQASGAKALSNGMTISRLLSQLEPMRKTLQLPVVVMGYLNPLLQFGFEKFCKRAAEVGIDGLIIPDIPVYEYEREYKAIVEKYGLDFIFLVTPETSIERIRKIDSLTSGFLYAVSSSSITGSVKNFSPVESYLKNLQDMQLTHPVLVGFGIRDSASYQAATKHAQGAIIGTAFIQALEKESDIEKATKKFIAEIR
jgi:tryptophan synthase alpha chain